MRVVPSLLLACALGTGATLEKLALEEMIQKSTDIVRGRVLSSTSVRRGAIIYTLATVTVSERWKGPDRKTMEVALPGGNFGGVKQMFSGVPTLVAGTEYVLFLWTGPSGMTQIVGLSQGMLDLKLDTNGQPVVNRAPITDNLVDPRTHLPATDDPWLMSLDELRTKVQRSLGAARE